MTFTRPRVLFISHSSSRNGATILLLNLVRWLRANVDWNFEFLVHGGGPLLDEFRSLGRTVVWLDPEPALNAVVPRSLVGTRRWLTSAYALFSLPSGAYDLIYANTSAAAPLVRLLRGRAPSLLWHVHELAYALHLTLSQDKLLESFRSATRYVVVSNAVRSALADYRIPEDRIDLVNGFVAADACTTEKQQARRNELRAKLQIPSDAFLVGGCGTLGWRKGSDVFLQIARRARATLGGDGIYFLWVGGGRADAETLAFQHDLRVLGLADRCLHVPSTADVLDHYYAMDAFALTSREDPFPLVVLEAAERRLPVICFEQAGGASEFVVDGCGVGVPYLDVGAFADEIVRLQRDRRLADQIGGRGQRKVQERYRVESQAPKLLRSMQLCLSARAHVTRSELNAVSDDLLPTPAAMTTKSSAETGSTPL